MTDVVQRTEFAIQDEQLIHSLWEVYSEAFRDTSDCIEIQQCYTEETFKAAMRDPEHAKFIVQEQGGRALGLELATSNLEKATVAYVNPQRLINAYPDAAREGRLWYITALVVRPDVQGTDLSALIVELITTYAVANRIVFAFDYAIDRHADFPVYVMHQVRKAIQKHALPVTKSAYEEIGGQHYGVIILE